MTYRQPHMPPPSEHEQIVVQFPLRKELWRRIDRQLPIVMSIFALIVFGGFFLVRNAPNLYESRGVILLNTQAVDSNHFERTTSDYVHGLINLEIAHLYGEKFQDKLLSDDFIKRLSNAHRVGYHSIRSAKKTLNEGLVIEPITTPPGIEIHFVHEDPQLARDIVADIIDLYYWRRIRPIQQRITQTPKATKVMLRPAMPNETHTYPNNQQSLEGYVNQKNINPEKMQRSAQTYTSISSTKVIEKTAPAEPSENDIRLMSFTLPKSNHSNAEPKPYKHKLMMLLIIVGSCAGVVVGWFFDRFGQPIQAPTMMGRSTSPVQDPTPIYSNYHKTTNLTRMRHVAGYTAAKPEIGQPAPPMPRPQDPKPPSQPEHFVPYENKEDEMPSHIAFSVKSTPRR